MKRFATEIETPTGGPVHIQVRVSRVIPSLVLAATAASAAAAVPPDSSTLGGAIDRAVAPLVRSGELSGQLIVARGGRVWIERCWGAADRERHTPMVPTTRMCIASITKPVNQVVALKLLADGRISSGDTIGRYLPGFPHGRITVEQLLRHTSGGRSTARRDTPCLRACWKSPPVGRGTTWCGNT
jgi:CubicO group peptidase (beta-lactamase class C family)